MAADMVDAEVPDGLRASHADRDRVVERWRPPRARAGSPMRSWTSG
ncbi:hypothetical protein ABT072_08655 [Streptomyces sp. NPDC002589]